MTSETNIALLILTLIRHRYAADRLKKSENVIEKYKKKLEDMAELRRELKVRSCPVMLALLRS